MAGARALRLFCTPALSRHRAPDHEALASRARFHLREARSEMLATRGGPVVLHVLEPAAGAAAASVLLVHGWTGEASFMSAFADFFRRRGLRAVLVDLPAHDASPGRHASLIDSAHAVVDVARALAPVRLAVGHSIGGLALLVAAGGRAPMRGAAAFEAVSLVATPDRFAEVTRAFGAEQGLGPRAQRSFERRLERLACRPLGAFNGSTLLAEARLPALVVHARDDAEVPFADAERIAAAGASAGAELLAIDGLGHRAILYAPPVVRSVHAFLARRL